MTKNRPMIQAPLTPPRYKTNTTWSEKLGRSTSPPNFGGLFCRDGVECGTHETAEDIAYGYQELEKTWCVKILDGPHIEKRGQYHWVDVGYVHVCYNGGVISGNRSQIYERVEKVGNLNGRYAKWRDIDRWEWKHLEPLWTYKEPKRSVKLEAVRDAGVDYRVLPHFLKHARRYDEGMLV